MSELFEKSMATFAHFNEVAVWIVEADHTLSPAVFDDFSKIFNAVVLPQLLQKAVKVPGLKGQLHIVRPFPHCFLRDRHQPVKLLLEGQAAGERDIDPIVLMQMLGCLKKAGMPLREIKSFMELSRQGDATIGQRLEMIEQQSLL